MHVHSDTDTHTEVLAAHVWSKDSGVPWDFIVQDDLQPLSDAMKTKLGQHDEIYHNRTLDESKNCVKEHMGISSSHKLCTYVIFKALQ